MNLKSRPAKLVIYLLKLILSAALLWIVFRKVDLALVLKSFLSLPSGILLLVFLLSCVRHFLQFNNWFWALKLNPDYRVTPGQVFRTYMLGVPLRFILPGGNGSFAKVFFVDNSSKLATAVSTLSEKAVMTWSIVLFAGIAALAFYPQYPFWLRIGAVILIAETPHIALFLIRKVKRWQRLEPTCKKYGPNMLLVQLAAVMITLLQYWLLLNCMQHIAFKQVVIRMSLTQFSNIIPITISGLGLRESFAMHFLAGSGITAGQAVTATLSLFVLQDLIPAVIGTLFLFKLKIKN